MLIKLLPKDVFTFQDSSMREFFSVREVAKLLNISHSAVLYHVRLGNLKSVQVGKIYIIAKEDFGDFLKSQQKKKEKKSKKNLMSRYCSDSENFKMLIKYSFNSFSDLPAISFTL